MDNSKNQSKIIITLIIILIGVYLYINLVSGIIFFKSNNIKYGSLIPSIYVYREIFVTGDYDNLQPKDNWVVFDVGGNIGLYSLYLQHNFSNLKIHTFEPIKDLHEKLKHNLNQKKTTNKLYLNNFGLGEKQKDITINFFPNADALSTINDDLVEKKQMLIETKCKDSYFKPLCKLFYSTILTDDLLKSNKENILIITMSDYINKNKIKKINLVKIDVEGYEYNVLQGIDKKHFDIIDNFIIEVENYNSSNLDNIIKILQDNNYEIKYQNPDKLWNMIVASKKIIDK